MFIKFLIVLVLIAIIASLASSFFFMMRDDGNRHRAVNGLVVRVSLSALLIVLIGVAVMTGNLEMNAPPF
ncbi:twin transmembrane helix small protein [Halomonadaceae bacterium KBTZ08]